MKVGIVTIYDGNNIGSFLQAVSLKFALESLGHDVSFVQRMTEDENLNLFYNRSFSKSWFFPLNYIAKIKRMLLNQKDDQRRREEIKKIYDVLRRERIPLKKIEVSELEEIDVLICGSDEIWNFNNTSISVPFYSCLNYGEEIKKIAFAVSIGTSSSRDFYKNPDVVQAISKFTYIYPRDYHSRDVLSELLHRELENVCDPTLLVDRKIFVREKRSIVKAPYLMVYAYDLTDQEEKLLLEFSRNTGLKIVSVLHYLKIADIIVTESPYDFANLILNAEYCYTSTFHGTIFCTLFAKRFLYHPRRPKVREIASYLEIEDRLWETGKYDEFDKLMRSYMDRCRIDNRLAKLREHNMQILRRIVENEDL